MKDTKVGILGLAHGHVITYCLQWNERPDLGINVVGAWDHNAQRTESSSLVKFDSVESLLTEVDSVLIGAETCFHADLVEAAATAGKAIVLQKPLALSIRDGDRIVEAVRRAGVPFTLAWQMRVDPQNLKIKEKLLSGELGRPLIIRRRHGLGVHTWNGFAQMWHNDAKLNRDIWADDAAHAIDFIYWLLGMPESVTAEVETLLNPEIPNDNGIAIFRYPGGPLAEVVCSFTCVAHENTTEVVGERGSLIQNYGDVPSCNVPREEGSVGLKWFEAGLGKWTNSEIASPKSHAERIAGLASPLAEFLHGDRPAIATAEEGRDVLRMVLATYVSSRHGRRVPLDHPEIDLL